MLEIAIENYSQELERIAEIATSGYFLGMGVKYGPPDYFLNKYPEKWTNIYEENNYFFGDPIVVWTFAREGATRWSEQKFPDPRGILKYASKFGMKYGATFSTKVKRKKYFLSVARSDRELTDSEMNYLSAKLESFASAFSGLKSTLSTIEIEALRVAAEGFKQTDAAEILRISVSAYKLRLDSAQSKLGVRNTAAAIRRATIMQII